MEKKNILDMQRVSIETFKQQKKIPLIIILDNIRSMHNVGAIFRTMDAFALEKVYLCGITATPPNAEIHKTALGAEDSVTWEYVKETENVVEYLQQKSIQVFAIEQVKNSTNLINLHKSKPQTPIAIVFGNEVKGIQQKVINKCDGAIEIPQFGTKHSLNVSVSAGIVMWELFKIISSDFEIFQND